MMYIHTTIMDACVRKYLFITAREVPIYSSLPSCPLHAANGYNNGKNGIRET